MPTAMEMVARWESRERPLFKGRLIDFDGPPGPDGRLCCCAQGDVLRCAGVTDEELRRMEQNIADRETARILGISLAHAVLLRHINDKKNGAPQSVLKASGLTQILGPNWRLVLAFYRHLDTLSAEDLRAVVAAGYAAWDAAGYAAWVAAGDAARELVVIDVPKATSLFLKFFFADVPAWIAANRDYRDPGIVED